MAGMTADEVYVLLGDEITLLTEEVKQMEGWEPIEHKGTVQIAEDLPTDAKKGWMYNIATDSVYGAAGMNVVMTSKGWDPMGPIINMNLYLTKEEGTKSFQPKGNYLSGTDTDLKESGRAADAKVTGEKIAKNSSDIAKKLGKNQGSENSGKVAGINEVGDIVPMFPMGVEYNSETNCLEFGSDQKMKLNQGIGLDNTLTKSGSAADAGVTGKKINSLEEDLEISLLENDRLYEGTNLAEKFKDEIANYSDIWQWIKARIKAGNFAGIHVNDFIRWQTTDNKWIESHVAGINTYRRYGDREVPNHIDFISKDLWPTLHAMNPVNYNNGIIPTENLSGDGTKTAFVLTNEMAAVASVTIGGAATTAYTYDADTHTITFTAAPVAGTNNIVVTGTGSEYPWLASDLYLYANSLKGHVAGGTSKTLPVKLVDYTKDGIWSKLPEALKAVIVTKRALLPKRYSTSGVLSNNNDWGWQDMGKLWIPSEIEVYGHGIWADDPFDKGGFSQYPIFNCNMRHTKGLGDGGKYYAWWLISANTGTNGAFCRISSVGHADYYIASYAWVGLPVCFRIAA